MTPLLGLSLAALGAAGAEEAHFVDASVHVDGVILDARFLDLEDDGPLELFLAVRTTRGERELRLHRTGLASIEATPFRTIPVLDDVVAWSLADVRAEPEGRELVFLTRSGAWSFDPSKETYRDNIAKLVDLPLLYDVPDPRGLPYWPYVLPGDGHERLLLPDREGFSIHGPGEDPAAPWPELARFEARTASVAVESNDVERQQRELESERRERELRFSLTVGADMLPFLRPADGRTLVSDSRAIPAPAIVDVDGDGERDLVLVDGDRLRVHLAGPDGIPSEPTRVEKLPPYLRRNGVTAALRIVDLDGDGRRDVLGVWNEEIDGIENGEWRVYVMFARDDRLLPPEPDQVLRFEAAVVVVEVARVDRDRHPDLVIRRFELPSRLEAMAGLEFRFSHLLYLGERRAFERKPSLKRVESYDEESVAAVIANRSLTHDCSGDGIADLVEVDIEGRVAVRRLRRDSSFFGGTSWELDGAPWKLYESRGTVASLEVRDLNGDGLGDVVSRSDEVLTVLLSQRGGGR